MEYIQVMKEELVIVCWLSLCYRVKSEMFSWSKSTPTLEAKTLRRNTQNLACWTRYWTQHSQSAWQSWVGKTTVYVCIWSITLISVLSSKDLGTIGPSYDTQKQTTTAPTSGGLNGEIINPPRGKMEIAQIAMSVLKWLVGRDGLCKIAKNETEV